MEGIYSQTVITTCCNLELNSLLLPNLAIKVRTFSSYKTANELQQTVVKHDEGPYKIFSIIDGTTNVSQSVNIRGLIEETSVSLRRDLQDKKHPPGQKERRVDPHQ